MATKKAKKNPAKRTKKLKLFLWEGVLSDYTDGVAFALAETEEQARELVGMRGLGKMTMDEFGPPTVIEAPFGFYLYGGG